jgi:putative transposase
LGISRGMLYYKHKRDLSDEILKEKVIEVMKHHKSYGHRSIALELKLNKKSILRIMQKYHLKPQKRRSKKPVKKDDIGKPLSTYKNEIELFCPIKPNIVWVSDFTYISFQGRFIYLATVMDLFTREIIGWSISKYHTKELIMDAFKDAVSNIKAIPIYFHSDQGSEYDSYDFTNILESEHIIISMSRKSSPWENGFQESFYSKFKLELENANQYQDLGELIEAIHHIIYYLNHDKIHLKLKMSPVKFRLYQEQKQREYLFKEMGA